jgi:hypothetical protein
VERVCEERTAVVEAAAPEVIGEEPDRPGDWAI